jgi:hypothetical protein
MVCVCQIVENIRRILLTGVLGVVTHGTAVQVVVGIVIAMVYIRLYSVFGAYTQNISLSWFCYYILSSNICGCHFTFFYNHSKLYNINFHS